MKKKRSALSTGELPLFSVAYPPAEPASLPLGGIRVLDLSQVLAGPCCASMLGDLGAEVIKIEPPSRDLIAAADDHLGPGYSAYYAAANRNKRYAMLDFTVPSGRAELDSLIRDADIAILNLRPQSLAKLRLRYEDLVATNPTLIYCLITGFGETGPRCAEPGMDLIAQALGGIMGTTGEAAGAPVKASSPIADFASALFAIQGILAALWRRGSTGQGAKVGVNLLDSTVAMLGNFVPQHFATGEEVVPIGGGHPQLVPYQAFEASDGWFVVACISQAFWRALCVLLERQAWIDDPRYRTNTDRRNNRSELVAELATIFCQQSRAHWVGLLASAGVPTAEINRFSEVFRDPQVIHNAGVVRVSHATVGDYAVVRNPVILDNHSLPVRLPVGRPEPGDTLPRFTERQVRHVNNGIANE
ncbi:MAG: CoA transferase [Gammaproteobacteria bacterium]|nr:CoA transferase [Gammaproteobacteria bacterium]